MWENDFHIQVAANDSRPVRCWARDMLRGGPELYLCVHSAGRLFTANRHFFAATKDLHLAPQELDLKLTPVGPHELRADIQAKGYTHFVHLTVPDEDTLFSDNYFDLEPGERHTVIVTNHERELRAETVMLRAGHRSRGGSGHGK
jgi:beta-mannosidase